MEDNEIMSIDGIHIYPVKSIDEYWIRLEKDLELLLSYLKNKHEYGTTTMCSEYGIQLALPYLAEKIAKKLNIDVHKTKCICMAVGLCFPQFGSYGLLACEKYIMEHTIALSKNDMKIGAIEACISDAGAVITPQLEEALYAYFENSTAIMEVNVARYCQCKANESRLLMKKGLSATESIQKSIQNAEENFSVESSIIMEDENIAIPQEMQEKVNKELDDFIKWCGMPNGIFMFITS